MTFRGDRCRIDGEHDRSQREGAPLLVPLGVRDHQPADLATSVAEGVDRIADRLERTLRVRRVDVVALTRAAVPLRYRVIRDGMLIVSRDAACLERFIVESTLQYLDFLPLREHAFRIQRAAILAHGR